MAQLIQMRQQISAIESIKKITNTMRLISMSAHVQLSHKISFLENYNNELLNLLNIIYLAKRDIKSNILTPEKSNNRTLIIIIGSQKGLAGVFNIGLFRLLETINIKDRNFDFITVGKKASEYIKKQVNILESYDEFKIQSFYDISEKIFNIIKDTNPPYEKIVFYSNFAKSFFVQVPKETMLVPVIDLKMNETNISNIESYIWEESIEDIFEYLSKEYLNFSIQSILFNSLLAEHSARFQSMNSATINAQELLTSLKLQYNKLRQSKITREITELSSNFDINF